MNALKISLLILFMFSFLLAKGQEIEPTKAPDRQTFSLGSDDLGALQNSVNLFTGEVALPLNLVSLPGRNSLNINVGIAYSSAGIRQQMDTWNLEAPTGILGMGWSMDIPKIVVDNKMTGTRIDDDFYLVTGGTSSKLIYTGEEDASTKIYESINNRNLKVRYNVPVNKWTVIDENGVLYTYGGTNVNNGSSLEWMVHWDNWIGHSTQTLNQRRQAIVWNLSRVENRWNEVLNYHYRKVERRLKTTSNEYQTEASYLAEITDGLGQSVRFGYALKDADEFQEPWTRNAEPYDPTKVVQNVGDGYQERIERDYLHQIETFNNHGRLLERIEFNYGELGSGSLKKRLLTGVRSMNYQGVQLSNLKFGYLTSGNRKGSLQRVTTTNGGKIEYEYNVAGVTIAKARRDLVLDAPAGYAEPRAWVGPDYVVVAWRQLSNGNHTNSARKVLIDVYQWDGAWRKNINTQTIWNVELNYNPGGGGYAYKNFQILLCQDHFAILHENSNGSGNLYLYQKNRLRSGDWHISNQSIPDNKLRLIGGDNFVAVGTRQAGRLYTYQWNASYWKNQTINNSGDFSYGAANNYIICNDNDPNPDEIYFYYLNELGQWITRTLPSNISFTSGNGSGTTESFWHTSNSFAVAMADDNNNEFIYWWDENFNIFKVDATALGSNSWDDSSPIRITDNSLVGLSPKGFGDMYSLGTRFDGYTWHSTPVLVGKTNGIGNSTSYGNDYIFWPKDYTGKASYKFFDVYTNQWSQTQDIHTGNNQLPLVNKGLNHFFARNKFYYLYPDGTYNQVSTILDEPLDYPWFNSGGNGITIIEDGDDCNVYKLKNNAILTEKLYSESISFAPNMIGRDIFVTYSAFNMIDATRLTMHIWRDGSSKGAQKAYPVTEIRVNDGYAMNYMTYDYDATKALFTPDGSSARFNKVAVIPGSYSASSKPFGSTEYYFFNGLTSTESALAFPTDNDGNADTHYLQVQGAPYAVIQKNSAGFVMAETYNSYRVYQDNISYGSTYGNWLDKSFWARIVHQSKTVDGITNVTTNNYVGGFLKSTVNQYTEYDGSLKQVTTDYVYGFERYPALEAANILNAVIQTRTKTGSSTYISAETTRWKDWGSGKWAPWKTYVWNGVGQSNFNWGSSTDPSNFLKTSEVVSRDTYGPALESRDMEEKPAAVKYDAAGAPIASFRNANAGEVYAANFDDLNASGWYTNANGFEVNEHGHLLWTLDNVYGHTSPSFTLNAPDDFVAEFDMRIERDDQTNENYWAGFQFNKNAQSHSHGSSGFMVYMRKNGELNIYQQAVLESKTIKGSVYDWRHFVVIKKGDRVKVFVDGEEYFDITKAGVGGSFVSFNAYQIKSAFDNLRIYPTDAYAKSSGYHPQYKRIESETGSTGLVARYLYDDRGRQVASIDDQGRPASASSGSLSVDRTSDGSYHANDPDLVFSALATGDKGFYDDFSYTKAWTANDIAENGKVTTWSLEEGKLLSTSPGGSTGGNPDSYYLDLGEELNGRVAIEFDLYVDNPVSGWNFGFAMGGENWPVENSSSGSNDIENAVWTYFSGYAWQVYDQNNQTSSVVINSKNGNNAAIRMDGRPWRIRILANVASQQADYYVDGKLCKANVGFRKQANGIQKFAFLNYGRNSQATEWQIDNFVVYTDPVQSVAYFDAVGKTIQTQSEEENDHVMVSASLYDKLGRAAVQVKPTKIASVFGYRPNFATGFDWTNGGLGSTSEACVENNGDRYAYSRTIFDNSPLGRVVRSGGLGSVLKAEGSYAAAYQYGTRSDFSSDLLLPPGLHSTFSMTKITGADGEVAYDVKDQLGRTLYSIAGPITGSSYRTRSRSDNMSGYNGQTVTRSYSSNIQNEASVSYTEAKQTVSSIYWSNPIPVVSSTCKIGATSGGSDVHSFTGSGSHDFLMNAGTNYYVQLKKTVMSQSQFNTTKESRCMQYAVSYCNGTNQTCIDNAKQACMVSSPGYPSSISNTAATAQINYQDAELVTGDVYSATSYEYDIKGNLSKVYHPAFHSPTPAQDPHRSDFVDEYTYDHFGRVKTSTTPDAGTSRMIYDKYGKLRFSQDANGASASTNYFLYTKYNEENQVIEEGYHPIAWNEALFQDYATSNPSWPSESLRWRKKIDYYGVWDFYKRGAVKKIETNNDTDAAVEVTETFDYDIYGNVIRTAQQLATETENVVEYEYNAAGQLSKEIYLNDYIDDITLDAADKVGIGETKAVVSNESIVMQPGFEAAAGSSFSATAVSGSADIGLVVTYHYDIAGNLKNIGKGGDKNFFATYIYGKNGEMSQEKMFNDQIASTFSYNSSGLLTGITHNKVNGGASYYSQSLRYFPSEGGNNYRGLIGRMDFSYQHTLYATSSKPASHYFGFGYDKLGRLTSANNVIHNDFDLSVSYDANGNYLSMARGGNAANYSYQNGTNKVISLTGPNASQYAYDQIGNVRSSSGNLVSFTYDPYINKPTVFNNEGTNYSYQYGGAGQRVLKSQNSSNKTKYIHGSSLYPKAEEQVISGTTHYRFSVRGETGMLAMQYDGAWYFMLKDHLGSPRAIVNENLQVVAWFEWGATGELIAAGFDGINETEAPHLYTGHEVEDLNKGLYHFIARFYDADLGRFYGVDPAGQFSSPYMAFGGNPVILSDADGEFAFIPVLLTTMKFVGYAISAYKVGKGFVEGGMQGGLEALTSTAFSYGLGVGIGASIGGIIPSDIYGLLPGAAVDGLKGGAAGGLSSGLASFMGGGDFGDGFFKGALSGGITGGIAGGYHGYQLAKNSNLPINPITGSFEEGFLQEYLENFAYIHFGNELNSIQHKPTLEAGKAGSNKYGITSPNWRPSPSQTGGPSTINIKKSLVRRAILKGDIMQLYMTTGHEIVHAGDFSSGKIYGRWHNAFATQTAEPAVSYYAEIKAYRWSLSRAQQLNFRVSYYRSKLNHYLKLMNNALPRPYGIYLMQK